MTILNRLLKNRITKLTREDIVIGFKVPHNQRHTFNVLGTLVLFSVWTIRNKRKHKTEERAMSVEAHLSIWIHFYSVLKQVILLDFQVAQINNARHLFQTRWAGLCKDMDRHGQTWTIT